jgi:hypothetical protein
VDEYDQSILYACMEIPQWNSSLYTNKSYFNKIKRVGILFKVTMLNIIKCKYIIKRVVYKCFNHVNEKFMR